MMGDYTVDRWHTLFTRRVIPCGNLESLLYKLTFMRVERKLENLEQTHISTGRACEPPHRQ